MITVYLAGPIADCTDEEAAGWRRAATAALLKYGFATIDPFIRRDYRTREDYDPAEVVEADKADIDASNVLLANCWKPSVGTCMEILYAWERKKRVIIMHPQPEKASPWLHYHSEKIFDDGHSVVQWFTETKWVT